MDIQQVQIFILDGVLLLLSITVLLMEKNAQRVSKKLDETSEMIVHITAGSIMKHIIGIKEPVKKKIVKKVTRKRASKK